MDFNSHLQSSNETILYLGKTVDLIIALVQGEMDVKKHYWKEIEVNDKSFIIQLFP